MDPLWAFELQLLSGLQTLAREPVLALMSALTFLGSEDFYLLVLPAVFWSVHAGLGLRVGVMLILSTSLNGYLKVAFHGPRPYWLGGAVRPYALESSFGLPSGHAQNSAALWGLVGWFSRRRWAAWAAGLLIVGIGFSRLVLGVHFISDVLLGLVVGLALLRLYVALEQPVVAWYWRFSFPRQIAIVLAGSLALIALNLLVLLPLAAWTLPETWQVNLTLADPDHPLNPLTLEGIITSAGTWLGLGVGATWLWRSGGYSAGGSLGQRLARYLVGLIGVGVLWYGLGQFFPRGETLLPLALRFVRYSLVGGWIAAVAPALFLRLRLARRPASHSAPFAL